MMHRRLTTAGIEVAPLHHQLLVCGGWFPDFRTAVLTAALELPFVFCDCTPGLTGFRFHFSESQRLSEPIPQTRLLATWKTGGLSTKAETS